MEIRKRQQKVATLQKELDELEEKESDESKRLHNLIKG